MVTSVWILVVVYIALVFVSVVVVLLRGADEPRLRNKKRATGVRKKRNTRNRNGAPLADVCNRVTASSYTTVDVTGRPRPACRCHWPTLFAQESLFTDCDVPLACDGNTGILVHKITRQPLTGAVPPIDIHDYECSKCAPCNLPGPDPHTGLPSCLPRPFNDRERDMCLYGVTSASDVYTDETAGANSDDSEHRTTKPMIALNSRFVDKRFLSAFTDRARDGSWVPNPCEYDLFTGARLDGACELRLTRRLNIAYCAPLRDNVMTAVKEDTYLTNNLGAYPNVCFRFTSNDHHVNGYVVEYFLRKRNSVELPSPVVSMRIARSDVLGSVVSGLGLTNVPKEKMLLFTQPEPPSDVNEFPHPFNKRRMADFTKELNHWLGLLPAKCSTPIILYNCSAPIQPLAIPECALVGDNDRSPADKSMVPHNGVIGDQTTVYARSAVACRNPEYDARFPIVPNFNVKPGSTNSLPTSAILFFDKSNNTVYPHWKEVGDNVWPEYATVQRYVREKLRSVPNETLE